MPDSATPKKSGAITLKDNSALFIFQQFKRGCLIKNSSKSMQKYEKHGQNYILANS
jgi:hypothetical protein